jgi:hypothetical protein
MYVIYIIPANQICNNGFRENETNNLLFGKDYNKNCEKRIACATPIKEIIKAH